MTIQKKLHSAKSIAALLLTASVIAACGASPDATATPAPATIEAPTEVPSAAAGNVLAPATEAVTTTASAQQSPLAAPVVTTSVTDTAEISPSVPLTAVIDTLPAPTTTMTTEAVLTTVAPAVTGVVTMSGVSPTTTVVIGTASLSTTTQVTTGVETLPASVVTPTVVTTTAEPSAPAAPGVVKTAVVSPAITTKFDLSKISLNPAGVARRVSKIIEPPIANVPNQPPTANGLPGRVQYRFDRDRLSTYFNPRERQMLILPVDEYRAMFAHDADALSYFDSHLDTLKKMLATKPPTVTVEIPLFPPLGAAQVFAAQIKYLSFEGGTCVRFVTMYAQDVSPVTSDRLFYTCQGLTSDGKNLVSFVYPVSSAITPASLRRVPPAVLKAIEKDPKGYFARIIRELNALSWRGFLPTLNRLDAVMQSLTIKP